MNSLGIERFRMLKEYVYSEKYRPKTIAETILPKALKNDFQGFVEKGQIPNLILAGKSGIGKTTVAIAMLDEIGADYLLINASLNGNIDTLRNDISTFASAVSLYGGRKFVILDEADHLTSLTQDSLRGFIQEFSSNCGFIFTCNFKMKIIEALHSRCSVIDFKIPKKEAADLAMQFFKRIEYILKTEKIKYDKAVVVEFIQKYYPDWRRVLNELQRYALSNGEIDIGILSVNIEFKILLDLMKIKNFTEIRKWVAENSDQDQATIFRWFYDNAAEHFKPQFATALPLFVNKYQVQAAFVADPLINLACFILEVMIEGEFK